jgi:hypothetical protein
VADDGGLLVQRADHLGEVVGDLDHALAGEDLGVRSRLLDRLGVVGPARRQWRVSSLLEDRRPAIPAAWQQPEAVDEDHRRASRRVCLLDLV